MRGAILRGIKLAAALMAVCLTLTCRVLGQEYDSIKNECKSLQNTTSADLVLFLNGVIPDEKNGDCVTWAIKKLGEKQYEPAIAVLTKLLDFQRPPTPREKKGFIMHPLGVWDLYPAVGALGVIGKKALPEVLQAIEAESSSATARENAVAVWMEIHRYSDEHSKAVTILKQEEISAKDGATKKRLRWATRRAVAWCNPTEEAACRAAAASSDSGAPLTQ